MFRIWCEVSGGVTGTREAWLKSAGNIYETRNREEAESEAKRLRDSIGSNPYRTASFRYSVREV
jgi:hypothetical protein